MALRQAQSTIPSDPSLDASLAFLREGYRFVPNRCERFGSDIFRTRLLGRRWFCVRGEDAASMFYEPDRFTRKGALPASVLHLLQDKSSVATLDGAVHRERKAMFMALMTPERLDAMANLAAGELVRQARSWAGREVVLHDGFRDVLGRAVCAWAGVELDDKQASRLTRQLGAMIDNAGSVGPSNWIARVRRWDAERLMRRLVDEVRAGRREAAEETALHAFASHRDGRGDLLPVKVAAIELLNILRPTVAVARFMTFAALALHEHPEAKFRLATDDASLEAFVQEVRRTAPFFPIVAGVARTAFAWRDQSFQKGDRFILDLYGTDRDRRSWDDPDTFRPERFLDWPGNAFSMIPQGGGEHHITHRCAGEWLTVAVMKAMLKTLAQDIKFDVPPQDLSVDLSRMPALPKSGMRVQVRAIP